MQNELLWLGLMAVNFAIIMLLYRWLGQIGILLWIPIAVIIANIQVIKAIDLFGLHATLGNIVYGTTFLVTDILSENHGKKAARLAVYIGFVSLIAATVLMNIALAFVPSAEDFSQESLNIIFSLLPRIAVGSLLAYLVSQLHDVWSYAAWHSRLPAKSFIWLRNLASTLVSQALDSLIFTFIAFWGVFETSVFWEIVFTTYVLKALVALCDTPLVYLARQWHDSDQMRSQWKKRILSFGLEKLSD